MSGNITREGIVLDMEWMKLVGLGGMQNFDASMNTPQVVEKRLVYMTPEWKDAFRFVVTGPFQNLAQQDPMGMIVGPASAPPPASPLMCLPSTSPLLPSGLLGPVQVVRYSE